MSDSNYSSFDSSILTQNKIIKLLNKGLVFNSINDVNTHLQTACKHICSLYQQVYLDSNHIKKSPNQLNCTVHKFTTIEVLCYVFQQSTTIIDDLYLNNLQWILYIVYTSLKHKIEFQFNLMTSVKYYRADSAVRHLMCILFSIERVQQLIQEAKYNHKHNENGHMLNQFMTFLGHFEPHFNNIVDLFQSLLDKLVPQINKLDLILQKSCNKIVYQVQAKLDSIYDQNPVHLKTWKFQSTSKK